LTSGKTELYEAQQKFYECIDEQFSHSCYELKVGYITHEVDIGRLIDSDGYMPEQDERFYDNESSSKTIE
jgi:hypothetical protein